MQHLKQFRAFMPYIYPSLCITTHCDNETKPSTHRYITSEVESSLVKLSITFYVFLLSYPCQAATYTFWVNELWIIRTVRIPPSQKNVTSGPQDDESTSICCNSKIKISAISFQEALLGWQHLLVFWNRGQCHGAVQKHAYWLCCMFPSPEMPRTWQKMWMRPW